MPSNRAIPTSISVSADAPDFASVTSLVAATYRLKEVFQSLNVLFDGHLSSRFLLVGLRNFGQSNLTKSLKIR